MIKQRRLRRLFRYGNQEKKRIEEAIEGEERVFRRRGSSTVSKKEERSVLRNTSVINKLAINYIT